MERKKIIAIITGAISILIAVAYLILVFLLDSRGEMLPAPITDQLSVIIQQLTVILY
ncbi:hypothetical protein [Gloeothece verrucosa]|uniref:Glucose-inhibited division protein A n=1 Tax=Gloeothece verrucosa (strain PCC 7822) TaxID=497965 RepID=E0UFN7_GLOV7|nr:hypothetical protein [Gloeothece verrucosa]ADN13148.1 conserved hypothetical protein [Gloeothece verrucosa PCC 7822]